MKLWKTKRTISCVQGKPETKSPLHENNCNAFTLTAHSIVDRAMSPAQSEDSGLAPERGISYTTITIPRDSVLNLGIAFMERNDLSYPPVVASINPSGQASDFLAPGDRIHQIDGISTIGLTNQQILSKLVSDGNCSNVNVAVLEIEYSLPEYNSQNSLYVTSKLTQIIVERESGCLGLTLRGGSEFPLIITHVRPHGPVYKTGLVKPGDRLLCVDNVSLIGKTLLEAQQIIKCGGHISGYTNLTIEYDVSVIQNEEFLLGPIFIEIERPVNEKLGLILCNNLTSFTEVNKGLETSQGLFFIKSILQGSIADRCGALSVGDQLLSIDDIVLEHAAYSLDEVMSILDTVTRRGYTQIQIIPSCRDGIAHRCGQVQVGDQLVAINDQSVKEVPLSRAMSLLQNLNDIVYLKLQRTHDISKNINNISGTDISSENMTRFQDIYAKVQRKSNSPSTNTSRGTCNEKHRVFHVKLCKDKVYDDYGFSISDGLYERGVFINRIRSGGPADMCGMLKPFDRIIQVNEMKTLDFDCCLTVPLIATAGDKIEMIIQRFD